MKKTTIILSLGGSLIVPDKINFVFLKNFKKLISKNLKKYNFVIFCGGGKIAREYQVAGKKLGILDHCRLDRLGIAASILNANLVKEIFGQKAQAEIITVPNKKINYAKPVIIGAGWQPGWSTDYDAIKIAQVNKIKTVINLSNIEYVCNKDPKKFADARKIEKISWRDFRKIVGSKWCPGLNMPFDPIAATLAEKSKIRVVIMNGLNFNNLQNFINNKKFIGTEII